jgi:hypothetical protein
MPPHILPSGDIRGLGVAGAVDDATGAALAGGTALTTPVGVNTGSGVPLGAALALVLAVGACAPGAGADCDEQAPAPINDRNATKPCNLKRSFIAKGLATHAREVER